MTDTDLLAILSRVGGSDGHALAHMHGVSYGLALRWLNGSRPIPEPVAAWWRTVDAWVGAHPPPRQW